MKYFKNFPSVLYKFGNDESPVTFKNISVYADLFDSIRDQVTLYQDYHILDGDRPDTISYKLYGSTQYHWTFFLINYHLRLGGWPLDNGDLYAKVYKEYPDYAVQSTNRGLDNEVLNDAVNSNNIGSSFLVGQQVTAQPSGEKGIIKRRNIDIGQMIVEPLQSGGFVNDLSDIDYDATDGTTKIPYLEYADPSGINQYLRIISQSLEYDGTHHYEDSDGVWVDIDSYDLVDSDGAGSPFFKYRNQPKVTFLENLVQKNDALKQIKIIRPDSIENVVSEFHRIIANSL
tara:strand:+ start:5088 stop:5948 length:861 start_codon:yes stop_codon:yes gene_type:complete